MINEDDVDESHEIFEGKKRKTHRVSGYVKERDCLKI
jgi:hypothetical protein